MRKQRSRSAIRIVQFLYFLNPKFQASSHLLWLYSPVCVGPGWKPQRPVFSKRGSIAPHQIPSTSGLLGFVRLFEFLRNRILLSGLSQVYLTDLQGCFLQVVGRYGRGPMEFIEPSGVAADSCGNFLVGDSKNNKIKVKNEPCREKTFLWDTNQAVQPQNMARSLKFRI